jgi:hypothetical protein
MRLAKTRWNAEDDRGDDLVHKPVRRLCNRAGRVADQLQPPSAPRSLGSSHALALFVAADYPPPTSNDKWVGFG